MFVEIIKILPKIFAFTTQMNASNYFLNYLKRLDTYPNSAPAMLFCDSLERKITTDTVRYFLSLVSGITQQDSSL